MISSGKGFGDTDILIMDPDTRVPKRDGEVGEVWVSGKSISKGYWKKEEASQETFVTIEDRTYLRTGDLGVLVDDELYITGRIKDLIIIRGRNYYPQDIEKCAGDAHGKCRKGCTVVVAVKKDKADGMIVIQEVKAEDESELSNIASSIKTQVMATFGVTPLDIVLVPPKTVLKTTSGKVQRTACRKLYHSNALTILFSEKGSGELQKIESKKEKVVQEAKPELPKPTVGTFTAIDIWINTQLTTLFDIERPETIENLQELGLDSINSAELSTIIEDVFNLEMPLSVFYVMTKKSELVQYISDHTQIVISPDQEENPTPKPIIESILNAPDEDDIAIIGFDMTLPGIESNEALWKLMVDKDSTIKPIPGTRFYNQKTIGSEGSDFESYVGSLFTKHQAESFDYAFFGISKEEAQFMDPQQKLLIESVWKTIESAGYPMKQVSNLPIGVFIGASSFDFYDILSYADSKSPYVLTGTSH